MKTFVLRLLPNHDLKQELAAFVVKNNIQAGCILTCVGSLRQAVLRLADENIVKKFAKKLEIVSLVGTLSVGGMHLHISLADETGAVIGGHVKEGCVVHTTAELVIGELEEFIFARELDKQTGFDELVVGRRKTKGTI